MVDTTYPPARVYERQDGAHVVPAGAAIIVEPGGAMIGTQMKKSARSVWFNLDNGAGVTVDDVIMRPATAITIVAARIVYVDVTAGTVAAGSAAIGTTVAGVDIVAATAYANGAAVGATTAMTVVNGAVPAGTPVIVRHTGVAATAVGQAFVEIDYTVDP